jgi:hypothetical protein
MTLDGNEYASAHQKNNTITDWSLQLVRTPTCQIIDAMEYIVSTLYYIRKKVGNSN